MSDHYYSGSFPQAYQPNYANYNPKRPTNHNETGITGRNRNSYDIKESNISQQTIIHKARLYSPDRSQQLGRNPYGNNQSSERTKTKKSQITGKIHQIVDLCQQDRDADIQQFRDVITAEKKILGMLQESDQKQQVPAIDLSHFADAQHDRGTTFGPIRTHNYEVQKIQSRQLTRRQAANERPTAARDNIYKKSAIDDLKTDRNLDEPSSNLPGEIRQIAQQKKSINDETEKMIEQIQRKAMEEIEGLRSDKIQLMKRLNAEIKAHNEQKKLRMALENELAILKGLPFPNRIPSQQNQAYPQPPIQPKPQQKYYSQPHFKQAKNRVPAQPYFAPTSAPFQRQEQNQLLQSLKVPPTYRPNPSERQLIRLQDQNNLLKSLPAHQMKINQRSLEKESLRRQVSQLNNLIGQYQSQFNMIRFEGNNNGLHQLQNLLEESQKIDQEALRLLRKNEQQGEGEGKRYKNTKTAINQEIVQQTNNFKRRLIEAQNQHFKNANKIEKAVQKNANPKPVTSTYSNRMIEFERILSDMNNAAR